MTVAASPEEATKSTRGMEDFSCETSLWKFVFFSLKKRRLQGDLIVAFQYLKGASKKEEESFTRTWGDRTWCNGFKLEQSKLRLEVSRDSRNTY